MLKAEDKSQLKLICPSYVDTDDWDLIKPFLTDWRRGESLGVADLVLLPKSTEEVSRILKYCNTKHIKVFCQGGNTGLVGGSVPDESGDGIVLSLTKMNNFLSLASDGASANVEAGCIIDVINERLSENNLVYPISFGATGSATIGGSVATNAGGANAIKYGVTRDQIIGLEIVLANGEIIELGGTLKDTAGYSLKDLIIGSEGSLAVVTQCEIKTHPTPQNRKTLLLGIENAENANKILLELKKSHNGNIELFEFMNSTSFDSTVEHWKMERPGGENFKHAAYLLIELIDYEGDGGAHLEHKVNETLESLFETGFISDGVIASNEEQRRKIFNIRESISETSKKIEPKNSVYFDIAVPTANLPEYLSCIEATTYEVFADDDGNFCKIFAFGHYGDGNIHTHILYLGDNFSDSEITGKKLEIEEKILKIAIDKLGGTGWAEHGIGAKNIKNLKKFKTPTEINLMKEIKLCFDPNNILNPHRIIDLK